MNEMNDPKINKPASFPGFDYIDNLLDWFAGMAMQGLVSSAFHYMSDENAAEASTTSARRVMKDIGVVSYQIAEVMAKARKQHIEQHGTPIAYPSDKLDLARSIASKLRELEQGGRSHLPWPVLG